MKKGKYRRRSKWKVLLPTALLLSGAIGFAFALVKDHRSSQPWISLEPAFTEPRPPVTTAPPETAPPETTQPATLPEEPRLPDASDWRLLLVNPWNEIPEGFEAPELTHIRNGQSVDKRCYPDLQEMMDDCRAAGYTPLVCSSFRTNAKQKALYENKVQRVMKEGYSYEEALVRAAREVAVPGTSEHELGLAMDIVDENHIVLDESQEKRPTQQWLMENSWRYGFILRYPSDKSDITGIIYEPWHYRYVGREAAKEIYEQGICLEEYLGKEDHSVG